MSTDLNAWRQLRQKSHPLIQGKPQKETLSHEGRMRLGAVIFCFVFVIGFMTGLIMHWNEPRFFLDKFDIAGGIGLQAGLLALLFYLLWPLIGFLWHLLRHRRLISKAVLRQFSVAQLIVSVFALAILIVVAFHLHRVETWWYYLHEDHNSARITAFEWRTFRLLLWQSLWVFLGLLVALALILPKETSHRAPKHRTEELQATDTTHAFTLWLGTSTGKLLARQHKAALEAHQPVTLDLQDACKNILVLGGIGEGKTTRAMHPLLLQLLDQDGGGLIFDIKGDVSQAVRALAAQTQRSIITLGPHHTPVNLLAGLSPELAASFLKSACLLNQGRSLESFWIETAIELCRNSLGVLSFFPEHYHLQGLYRFLFEDDFRDDIQEQAYTQLPSLKDNEARLLKNYTNYYSSIYAGFDEKVKSGVQATIAQILSPFNHPALVDAFCTYAQTTLSFEDILRNGAIFLIDLPLSHWGLGGKVAYTLIKLRFFNLMQQRVHHPDWNQERPAFFMCDEYQEIVSCNKDGLSDLNFWDKARSSKTIGIISAQAISSFYAAIGDRDMANALLQNFRQKLCFKTEDQTTLDYLNRLTGHVQVARRSYSQQSGHTRNPSNWGQSHHHSSNESLSFYDKPLLDPQLVRGLGPNQAIALLSIAGYSMDDVLALKPVFFDKGV